MRGEQDSGGCYACNVCLRSSGLSIHLATNKPNTWRGRWEQQAVRTKHGCHQLRSSRPHHAMPSHHLLHATTPCRVIISCTSPRPCQPPRTFSITSDGYQQLCKQPPFESGDMSAVCEQRRAHPRAKAWNRCCGMICDISCLLCSCVHSVFSSFTRMTLPHTHTPTDKLRECSSSEATNAPTYPRTRTPHTHLRSIHPHPSANTHPRGHSSSLRAPPLDQP